MKKLLALALLLLGLPPFAVRAQERNYALSPAQLWLWPWAENAPFLMAGDVEGTHRADLLSLSPDGDLHVVHTSSVGKPMADTVALAGFAPGALAVTCGPFGALKSGRAIDAVVALFANGNVRIASDFHRDDHGKLQVFRNESAATLTPALLPQAPVEMVAGDFDGDGLTDLLLIGGDRRALLLRASRNGNGVDEGVQFNPVPLTTPFPAHQRLGVGTVGGTPAGDRRARLFYIDESGVLFRTAIGSTGAGGKTAKLAPGVRLMEGLSLDTRLAVGHFRGAAESDLIVGNRLFPGANPSLSRVLETLPTPETTRGDRAWLVADFDGNGKDDLVRPRKPGDTSNSESNTALIHFSRDPGSEQVAGYYATSRDGLPDAWKLGLIHPGGLDLKAMGCKVGQFDMLIEVIPATDVPTASIAPTLERVTDYYAALPVQAPDGSHGIHIHYVYRDPTSEAVNQPALDPSSVWGPLWSKLILPEHVGVVHYLGLQKGNRGGASSRYWTWSSVLWPCIVHEMGHQLGLSHGGRDPLQEMSAVYPSLMNYAYGYDIDGNQKGIGYSNGGLVSLGALHEEHLSKTLNVPYEKVKFMAGAPYHFHLKPGSTPDTTQVDWNWDGDFGETDVRADLNYCQGIVINPRFDVGHSYTTPVPVAQKDAGGTTRLLLIAGMWVAAADGSSDATDLSAHNPGRIVVRVWRGKDRDDDGARWSQPFTIAKSGVIGDVSAVSMGDATFVAYPTSEGVQICRLTLDEGGKPQIGEPSLIPNTVGALPALTACGAGQLAVTLWRSPTAPVALRLLSVAGKAKAIDTSAIGGEISLAITSAVPVAAVAGATSQIAAGGTNALWVARMAGVEGGTHAFHFEVCRFDYSTRGDQSTVHLADRRWVHGDYARRPATLLWEPEPALGAQGRLYLLAGGRSKADPDAVAVPEFCAMQTAYPNENEGWQVRRFDKPAFISRSAPGACWFEGNMVYAQRTNAAKNPARSDTVSLSFRGTGATPDPVGDFNDLDWIVTEGLAKVLEKVEIP